eukprot:TRINITY_DN1531_c0_g5_i1.p1 TRINITY_DN1531_c0_g5~~TRINITY_DN1531_c0_g5_i1.p1  ORF type:complete len:146 (+),score=6.92 TRINITY_DN1531_c0_g5_i1:689-1126(+)
MLSIYIRLPCSTALSQYCTPHRVHAGLSRTSSSKNRTSLRMLCRSHHPIGRSRRSLELCNARAEPRHFIGILHRSFPTNLARPWRKGRRLAHISLGKRLATFRFLWQGRPFDFLLDRVCLLALDVIATLLSFSDESHINFGREKR